MDSSPAFLTAIPVLVGLLFLVAGGWMAFSSARQATRSRTWTPVQGEVVSVTTELRATGGATGVTASSDGTFGAGDMVGSGGTGTRSVLVAHYRYVHAQTGETAYGRAEVPQRFTGGPGSSIALVYDPADPGRSQLAESSAVQVGGGVVFGAVLAVIGVVAMVTASRF